MKTCISFQFPLLRSTLIILMCKNHLYITQKNKRAGCSILQTKLNNKKKKPNKTKTPHFCHESILPWNTIPGISLLLGFSGSELLDFWIFILNKLKKKKQPKPWNLFCLGFFLLQSTLFALEKVKYSQEPVRYWKPCKTHMQVSEFTLSELITHSTSKSTLNCWHTKHTKN